MTTMTETAAQARPADRFLRLALKVDAIASGLTGAGMVAAPGLHADLYGLPAAMTQPSGLFLLAFAAMVWFASARRLVDARLVTAIIVLNAIWVAASAIVIAAGWLPLTPLGVGYTILQAAAVALFAELQFIGLRRVRRAAK